MSLMTELKRAMQDCKMEHEDDMPRRRSAKSVFEDIEDYFTALHEETIEIPSALAKVMCMTAMCAVKQYMEENGEERRELKHARRVGAEMKEQHEQHLKFKEVLEALRSEPTDNHKKTVIAAKFKDLNNDEVALLLELAKDYSKKGHADNMRMSIEQFGRMKSEIEKKLK